MDYHGSSFAALISASGAVREYETGPRRSRVATFHTSPTVVPSAGPTWRRGDTEFHCTSKLGMAKEATLGYVRLRQVTSGDVQARNGGCCFGHRLWQRRSLRFAFRGKDAFSGHQELWESSDGINGRTELLGRLHGESSAHEN